MRSRFLVPAQITVLVVLAVLLVGRALRGPAVPDALVAWTEIEAEQLYQSALSVSSATRVAVEAVGSFESDGDDLAAHAWILDAQTREVVWTMENARPERRGSVATAVDTVALGAGTYVVYFASYGSRTSSRSGGGSVLERLFNAEANWPNDSSSWKVIVQEVDGEVIRVLRSVPAAPAPQGAVVWQYEADARGGGGTVFQVEGDAPVALRVQAIGEGDPATRAMHDYVQVDDARTGATVWTMLWSETTPAGGSALNRRVDTTLALTPGIYRAHFIADRGHYAGRWHTNPPFDPAAWGATFTVEDALASRVGSLGLWGRRTPLVDMTGLGDEADLSAELTVTETTTVAISALGEIQDGTAYDYAWLTDASGERLWTMSKNGSTPAGGAAKNRAEVAIVTLEPGTYTLYVQTDNSHAFGDFNATAPEHPERWGVALFPLTESGEAPGLTALVTETSGDDMLSELASTASGSNQSTGGDGWSSTARVGSGASSGTGTSTNAIVQSPPAAPEAPLPPGTLVRMTQLGNNLKRVQTFRLDRAADLRIVAVGEITGRGAYDYGLIRDADGTVVWEMTRANTQPAGGGDLNRRFDGTVRLRAGTYTAQFRTDTSHAYGDFQQGEAPSTPEAWGMEIRRAR